MARRRRGCRLLTPEWRLAGRRPARRSPGSSPSGRGSRTALGDVRPSSRCAAKRRPCSAGGSESPIRWPGFGDGSASATLSAPRGLVSDTCSSYQVTSLLDASSTRGMMVAAQWLRRSWAFALAVTYRMCTPNSTRDPSNTPFVRRRTTSFAAICHSPPRFEVPSAAPAGRASGGADQLLAIAPAPAPAYTRSLTLRCARRPYVPCARSATLNPAGAASRAW